MYKKTFANSSPVLALITLGTFQNQQSVSAAPQTFTVNSSGSLGDADNGDGICETSTPGECTFLAAIQQASANNNPSDTDRIEFAIPGGGVHTITLPPSTGSGEPLVIDGYTQPGASENTVAWPGAMDGELLIEIKGAGLTLSSGNTVRGLIMNELEGGAIYTGTSSDVKIQGNYIFTDPSGQIAEWGSDSAHALTVYGSNTTVGGPLPEDRNVIAGRRVGLLHIGQDSVVQGNNFFTAADGVTPISQDSMAYASGVHVSGTGNLIGGTSTGMGNFLGNTSNDRPALQVTIASDSTIAGNHITGAGNGIEISVSSEITIGGTTNAARNVIGSTSSTGIFIDFESSDINIQGNYIGVGADGITPLPNGDSGIFSQGSNLTVGGSIEAARNVISSNVGSGISIQGPHSLIQGNYIGVGADGITPLPNGVAGIEAPSKNTVIGGSTVGTGNVISGNAGNGISLWSGSLGVLDDPLIIQGNYIGVGADGITPVPNSGSGIRFSTIEKALVGGVNPQESNIVANNGGRGITMQAGGESTQNAILGNSIYNNGEIGIDLGNDGVTTNDVLDPDNGSNDLLNFPELLIPLESGGDTNIGYRLDVPAGDYRIEFFENDSPDPTGNGEGQTYIGHQNVTSLGSGAQFFSTVISGDGHTNIRATATEIRAENNSGFGSTSEFSGPPTTDSDTAVTKSVADQDTIVEDGTVSYTVVLTSNGDDPLNLNQFTADSGDPIATALFNDVFPDTLQLDSVTGDVDCSEQSPSESFDPLFADHPDHTVASCAYTGSDTSLASGESLEFTLHFSLVDPLVQFGSSMFIQKNYVLSMPFETDPAYESLTGDDVLTALGATNNVAEAATTKPQSDVSMKKILLNPEDGAPGAQLRFELEYTNHGPDPKLLLESSVPFTSLPLFYDFLHPDLTVLNQLGAGPIPGIFFFDSGNPDLTCLGGEPGSAAMLLGATTYTDYGMAACWYTGADLALADQASLVATIEVQVANGSELEFANYAMATTPIATQDPDESTIINAVGGGDYIGGILAQTDPIVNNFSFVPMPTDIGVTSTIVNPEDIAPGATLYYDITLTNRGPSSFNFMFYNEFSSRSLMFAIVDALSMQFVGTANEDMQCVPFGLGSPAYWGSAAANHVATHQLVGCVDDGSGVIIAPDDSYTIRLQFTMNDDIASNLQFYATAASLITGDPDITDFLMAMSLATEDILDTVENDNFARAFASYMGSSNNGGGHSSGGSSNGNSNSGALSDTGENMRRFIILAGILLIVGSIVGTVLIIRRRQQE